MSIKLPSPARSDDHRFVFDEELFTRFYGTWSEHLHTADQLTLDHIAGDVEAMQSSPMAVRMRSAVDDERARRVVTAGIEAAR